MYLVTGGAGFIGSNVVARLARLGKRVCVSDRLRSDERWQNICKHEITDLVTPEQTLAWLTRHAGQIEAVVHLGAHSSTTETDVDLIVRSNIHSTFDLLDWCMRTQTRFIYASSAATYGDGGAGFDDDIDCDALARLRPLNAYGWSKHVVDRRIARLASTGAVLPPQWVGLKFFNVYGPNEYHKAQMQSLIARAFVTVRHGDSLRLFRSYRDDYPDGGQLRDFVYVRDCVDVILWFLDQPRVSGLFNLGTGQARSWLELADALFQATGMPRKLSFIDMPETLRDKYQYCTRANMQRLRAAGYACPFTSLEEGTADYVRNYLDTPDPYL